MADIQNPILRGFNPDPSICRVGADFYIATSTFEWYPGVQIHHSRDLANWQLAVRPLDRASQLDMRGNPDSCGVWAPSLSHADGLFWLIYTDVKRLDGNYKDTHNYLVTAPTIEGPWSDPVYMNSSGFDPSLFHDADGRKWFVNMVWNHNASHQDATRRGTGFFDGVLLQEYDRSAQRLTGPITNVFRGTERGFTEAPHLFRKNGYYYLITAEGGTGYNHAVTHARSREIAGPYETHPDLHVISARDAPDAPLQRTGHGQYVETPDGTPYHTFLCSRPLPGTRRSPMGRETGLQRCRWGKDDWLYLDGNPMVAGELMKSPAPDPAVAPAEPARIDFDTSALPAAFQWLRTPEPDRIFSTTAHPDALRLYGRESIGSWFEQSLVARRQTEWCYRAETALEFDPEGYQHMAGLVTYYNRTQFYYLYITASEDGARLLDIQSSADWPDAKLEFPLAQSHPMPKQGKIWLGVDVDHADQQFRYSLNGADWHPIGPVLDASLLSDEGVRGEHADFTGTFAGMAAQDLTGQGKHADFSYFEMVNSG